LEVFEGPLALLLHLIEKQELDITKVSLAKVTDQYLEYIGQLEHLSADILADFLVVAAKLLLIKSRALLPSAPVEEEPEDVGDDLVQRLREYKEVKEAAQHLREREDRGLRAYLRVAPRPRLERNLELEDVSLEALVSALREALILQPPPAQADHVVSPITISISDVIERIESLLLKDSRFSFNRLLRSAGSRTEIIVSFLAVLELVKAHRALVQQEQLFGEIYVLRADASGEKPSAEEPPEQ
jgi:segregation and condensation protein A